MDNQVDREKMLISGIRLNKGFTLLEIIIVLTIMSIASTSFYLLLRQPEEQQNLLDKINYFQELSLYTGSTYAFSRENIQIYANNEWINLEELESSIIVAIEDLRGNNIDIKKDEIYLIIAPGHELSIKKLFTNKGDVIEFN